MSEMADVCAGCDDAITVANRAPIDGWCTACHAQNMAAPVDHEALREVACKGFSAQELRDALAEALDMLDGYDDGRLGRVAYLRRRFGLLLDPTVAERRSGEWACTLEGEHHG